MPSKSHRSSKTPKPKSNPPQFKILSRNSLPDKTALQPATDLSEFEIPSEKIIPDPTGQLSATDQAPPSIISSEDATKTPLRPQSMPITTSHRRYRGIPSSSGSSTNDTASLTPSPIPRVPHNTSHTRSIPSSLENITNNTPSLTPSITPKKVNSPSMWQSQSPPRLQTPLRKSMTPAEFYAGPAFHASPAASRLPLPKSFSKSVPNLQKSSSLTSMMEKEEKKTDSDQSEESPTLRKSRMVGENKTDKESYFDMFFPSIKSEKTRQEKENNVPTMSDQENTESPCANFSKLTGSSIPSGVQASRHARHDTEGSVGGLFPLEIDDSSLPVTPKADMSSESSAIRWVYSPPIPLSDEERKIKTLELKRLLLSPAPQSSLSATSENPAGSSGKPPNPKFPHTQSLQDRSTSTSVLSSERTDTQPKLPQHALSYSAASSSKTLDPKSEPFSPPILQQPAVSSLTTSPSLNPRSKSFSPRNQPVFSFTPSYTQVPELPPSSTPTHVYSSDISTILPFTPEISQSSSYGVPAKSTHDSEQMNSMETYLRNVLQLDGRNGADGIQT